VRGFLALGVCDKKLREDCSEVINPHAGMSVPDHLRIAPWFDNRPVIGLV
jgi:hypothetical protein